MATCHVIFNVNRSYLRASFPGLRNYTKIQAKVRPSDVNISPVAKKNGKLLSTIRYQDKTSGGNSDE